MAIRVFINSVNSTSSVLMNTLAISQREGQRHTAEFVVEKAAAADLPVPGQRVTVEVDPSAVLEFGGIIQTVERQEVRDGRATTLGNPVYLYRAKCFCSDYKLLTDRRLAGSREFVNEFASNIARTLLTESLTAADGVIIDDITPNQGPEIKSFKVDYATVTRALDQLLTLCPPEWRWDIGYNRRARFGPVDTATVQWTIGAENYDVAYQGLTISYDNTARANKIVAIFDRYESDEQVETFGPGSAQEPDGSRREWTMAKKLARTPTVTLNGATQTVGVRDLDVSAQWWWSQDSDVIQRNPGISPPAAGATVEFRYVGFDRIEEFVQDDPDIAATATLEGTSGVYEELVTVSASVPRGDAAQIAAAILAAKKTQGATLRARQSGQTNNWRPRPSDTIRVTGRAGYPAQTFIVKSSTSTVQPAKDNDYRILLRTIDAVAGSTALDGLTFFSVATGAAAGTGQAISGGFVFGGGTAGETPWVTSTPTGASHAIDHAAGDRHQIIVQRDLTITVINPQDNRSLIIRFEIDGTQRTVDITALPRPGLNAEIVGTPNTVAHWEGYVIGGTLKFRRFDPGQ